MEAVVKAFGTSGRVVTPMIAGLSLLLSAPACAIVGGSAFSIAGTGVAIRGEGNSGGTVRVASLIATGRPGTLQIRLIDPIGQGIRDGLGACTGDSGGPVFEDRQGGPVVIGVISW